MNSRVNELCYGDMNELKEEEMLLPPILNQSSDVEVERDSCEPPSKKRREDSETSRFRQLGVKYKVSEDCDENVNKVIQPAVIKASVNLTKLASKLNEMDIDIVEGSLVKQLECQRQYKKLKGGARLQQIEAESNKQNITKVEDGPGRVFDGGSSVANSVLVSGANG
uniref:Uncharacterized protein n=1 Tax=Magallana gigas TaxID=29159 RepID=A0A8W8NTI3_MAGGI